MSVPPLRTLVTAALLAALLVGTWSNAAGRARAEAREASPAAPPRPSAPGSAAPSARGAPGPLGSAAARPAAPPGDPLRAPLCPGVSLTTVSDLGDPDASLATLRSAGDASPRARRFRGSVGGRRVVYVGEHPRTGAPTVWLTDGRGLCQVRLGPAPPDAAPAARAAAAAAPASAAARWVERIDDATFCVDRRLVEVALAGGEELAPAIRGVNGRLGAEGFTLSRVPPGSLPALVGLEAGDTLAALDGRPLTGLEAIVGAQAALARSARVTLTVLRAGVRRPIVLELR